MKRQKTPAIPYECDEDKEFFLWAQRLELMVPELETLYHIPNERTWKYYTTGIRCGVSDWHLPVPARGFSSLWLEMKRRKGGRVSPEQIEWHRKMESYGAYCVVAKGSDEAIAAVIWYLDLAPVPHLFGGS